MFFKQFTFLWYSQCQIPTILEFSYFLSPWFPPLGMLNNAHSGQQIGGQGEKWWESKGKDIKARVVKTKQTKGKAKWWGGEQK